jgi:ribosomal protein L11 methyltransferase
MTMYSALTTVRGQAAAEALAEAVEDLGPFAVGHFEVEDGSNLFEVGVHFEEPPDAVALDLLAAVHGARPFLVSEVPDVDWVAKVRRDLPPVVAGRFVVHGAHSSGELPPGLPLLVEAAMAFGTGHHGTTLGCLLAIDALEAEGVRPARVADLGTGTAVLAMAAALAWPGAERIVAGDNDPVAVDTARANVEANGLAGRVEVVEAAGLGHVGLRGPFDLVLANILKGPLIDLAPEVAASLAPGGRVILSGLLKDQADEVAGVYARLGVNEASRREIGDWATLTLAADPA